MIRGAVGIYRRLFVYLKPYVPVLILGAPSSRIASRSAA